MSDVIPEILYSLTNQFKNHLVLFNCLHFYMVLWYTYSPHMQNKLCTKVMSTCDFFMSACIKMRKLAKHIQSSNCIVLNANGIFKICIANL